MENYGDYTYNAQNPLKRFSHRRRFNKSIASIPVNDGVRLLDFGCGDGLFLNRLKSVLNEKGILIGYEPFLQPISGNTVTITASWEEIVKKAPFHYVTCFEVLEHFDENLQKETLKKILQLLDDDGSLIVSVPIENGFPSLVKNIVRKFSCPKNERHLYSIKNIMAACFKKKLPQYRIGSNYLSHLGFYHTDLEKVFLNDFVITEKSFSPFSLLGSWFNAQVFYKLLKPSQKSNEHIL
jgi:cyclopropane fatty-acyl-phospholipid synthase-like methyltransferase